MWTVLFSVAFIGVDSESGPGYVLNLLAALQLSNSCSTSSLVGGIGLFFGVLPAPGGTLVDFDVGVVVSKNTKAH